jgi:sarcosine oxidase
MAKKPHIVVVGAGAFGGWTAFHLLERGARVTLVDAWGPGNSRASSGGETRVMRASYGPDERSTEMAARALKLWRKYENKWKRKMLHRVGVLWMADGKDDSFERRSVETLKRVGIKYEEVPGRAMNRRWPQVNFDGIEWGIFEPECGYLEARASCAAVVEAFAEAGGRYRQAAVSAEGWEESGSPGLSLSDGSQLKADAYVFACGPWLGRLFPQAIGSLVRATKQDIFFFGTPPGDSRFDAEHLPVWGNHFFATCSSPTAQAKRGPASSGRFFYGIPGSDRRGFKVADDTRGPEFDPTGGERIADRETLRLVRQFVGFRFPGMKDAPLIETRVCQYEETPDGNFILDRFPERENVWIVGGGSGHGFKHGPAVGEMVAGWVMGREEPDARWKLSRFLK